MKPSLSDLHGALVSLLQPERAPTDGTSPAPPAAGAAEDSPAAPAPERCQLLDPNPRGCHLDVTVDPAQVVAVAQLLNVQGFSIDAVTGVDWIAAEQMEVIYDFFHPAAPWQVVVRTRVARNQPELPTISNVFPGANWHERETHEFFGIGFLGHPNLSPLLLPEDATYHPLRKDFAGAP
jgi:NADH-quinone oxidoreductase subunit C